MIDLPDFSTFAAALSERRFLVAAVISAMAGAARGFAGFGSSLIYVPLISTVYEPKIAAVTALLIDAASGVPYGAKAFPRSDRRDVGPTTLAALATLPLGTYLLVVADPTALRWFIGVFVLATLPFLAGGWRYQGKSNLAIRLAVGGIAGVTGGAVQLSGPPVILYWLGGAGQAAFVRANLMVYFTFIDMIGCVAYLREGLFTREVVVLSLLLGLPFILAMVAGVRWFRIASERSFRHVAYAIIALSALLSLPLFDGLLR
jgi:uncharacterized membrane protein YfcA